MNRSFFVMFFMYFFVVQSAVFGVVRGEPKFYIIGAINLIFIILMALFYKNFDTSPTHSGKKDLFEESKAEHIVHAYHATLHASKKRGSSTISYLFVLSIILLFLVVLDKAFLNVLPLSVWWFAGFYFVMLFLSAKKLLDKHIVIGDTIFLPKDFLFWTSLIVVVGVSGTLVLQVFALKLLFAACIGFIFFFIGASIIKDLGSSNIFKLFFTRFYLILIGVFVLIVSALSFSSNYQTKLASDMGIIQSLFTNGFSSQEADIFTGSDILSNGKGQVLSTSLGGTGADSTTIDAVPVDTVFTGGVSSDVISTSPDMTVATPIASAEPEEEDDRLSLPAFPTLMDTLIYLMSHYNVELSSQKNITFTYVSPKNPYYAQFRTAYDMKLIGQTANPSKRVLCQTYMVMKGLVEQRTVAKSADIKTSYRTEATDRGVLNGCKWNFYVKNINL